MKFEIIKDYIPPNQQPFEIVERKGLGHPDTLVDGIVELAEINYANYCLKEFGCIPHHNFDKAMLIGGMCCQEYGGAEYSHPIKFIFMGRGSKRFGQTEIPLAEIQMETAKKYLSRITPSLDVENSKCFVCESQTSDRSRKPYWFSPRSIDDLPEYNKLPTANDTATMISYYPLTLCEQLSVDMEAYFYCVNDEGLPYPKFEEFGQDIKVMVVRKGDEIDLTICVPQITYKTKDSHVYFERQNKLYNELNAYIKNKYPNNKINLVLNPGNSTFPYLVTGGSCIDFGEEGAVGRGNKTRGIISSFRPNTMEAPHGKNATYFVGKVIGFLADMIAKCIYEKTGASCQVMIQANMGDCLFDPSNILISVDRDVDDKIIRDIVFHFMSKKDKTTLDIINSKHYVPNIIV